MASESITRNIGRVTVDLSGIEVTNEDAGWYYADADITNLPTNATAFAVTTQGSWDANVFYMVNSTTRKISIRCPVAKTLGNNRKVSVFYY